MFYLDFLGYFVCEVLNLDFVGFNFNVFGCYFKFSNTFFICFHIVFFAIKGKCYFFICSDTFTVCSIDFNLIVVT